MLSCQSDDKRTDEKTVNPKSLSADNASGRYYFPENHVDDQDDGRNPKTHQDIADDDCDEIHP